MAFPSRRPRAGRLLDWLVIALCIIVFAGLAVYHYRRLDRSESDPARTNELAQHNFSEPKSATLDWPQWRGPNRDGFSSEAGILSEWPAGGPRVRWEQPTGEGFASVAVADGRAFTIFQDGANESVVCWDAETGKEIWRYSYECNYRNSYGSGPRSTPSVDGKCVYTVGATGMMHCLEADTTDPKGKAIWSKELLKEFAAPTPRWGVAFSPLVEGERVFIMPGGPNGNALAALDRKTGEVLWKKHDDAASYSSPIAATMQGRRQILFLTGSRLVSVSPDTGEQLWDFDWPVENACNIATPIAVDDYVFISASYGRGCAMLKIEQTADELKPSIVYKNTRMRNHFSSSVRRKNHVYGFDDSTLVCMDLRTGNVEWKERGFDKGSVLIAGDKLIIYGANGLLALAEASPTAYVEQARFRFSGQNASCWSVPVVAHGLLYVRDQKKLACLDVRAGK